MKGKFMVACWMAAAVAVSGCGAIDAPDEATDLRAGLAALAADFDAQRGRDRLLLLLSPA